MLRSLDDALYERLDMLRPTNRSVGGAGRAGARPPAIPVTLNAVCGMFGLFFTSGEVTEFDHAANADVNRFNRFFHAMLDQGVYLAPSAFEAGFLSTAHDDGIIDATLDAAEVAFAGLNS